MKENLKILLLIRAKYQNRIDMKREYENKECGLLYRMKRGEQLTAKEKVELEFYRDMVRTYDAEARALKSLFFDIAVDEDHHHVDYNLKKIEMDYDFEWEEYVDAFIKKNQ